jgi:hypothetical protein
MKTGFTPATIGKPVNGVRIPDAGSMEKPEIVPESSFAVYANFGVEFGGVELGGVEIGRIEIGEKLWILLQPKLASSAIVNVRPTIARQSV